MMNQHILIHDIIEEHGERVQNLKRYYPFFCLTNMSFAQYREGRFEELDMGYIVMALLRFFIDKNNFQEQGVTYEEYREFVLELIKRDFKMPLSEEEGEELASYVFEKITNGGKPFTYEYFDPADRTRKNIRVKYFDSHFEEDEVVYSVTSEGIEFYLDTKEVKEGSDINVAQLLLEKMIKSQNFKGGTDVVRRINNEVRRLNAKRNEVLALLSTDVFQGVKAFEEFVETGIRWFADEQKMFNKNRELLERTLERARQDSVQALEEIYRLDMELKKAIQKHSELLSACTELQKRTDEMIEQAKLSRLRTTFDFKEAMSLVMQADKPELLNLFAEPLFGLNTRKLFNFSAIDDMLLLAPEKTEIAEKIEKNAEITDYVYEDEAEDKRITANFRFFIWSLFEMLKEKQSFTLQEWNETLNKGHGDELFRNGDYYTFLIHLCQKKEYDAAAVIKKPDTFLEGIMAEVMKEAEFEQYRNYEFKIIMPDETQDTLRLLKVFEVSNIRFERSGQ